MTDESRAWFDVNLSWWDERVAIHLGSEFYDVEGFRRGRSTLEAFEHDEMPDVSGRSLLHLQCHFGLDTLSWARLGARVTGLDFSPSAIDAARNLASSVAIEATFFRGNVYEATELLHSRFDVIYTGKGALPSLPDLDAWAGVVAALLQPGGSLYLVEFHPFTDVFSYQELAIAFPYFRRDETIVDKDRVGSYADLSASTVNNHTVQWPHALGDIVSAIAKHGLRIQFLHEFAYTLYPRWQWLETDGDGVYRLPGAVPSLPMLFSMRAVRE